MRDLEDLVRYELDNSAVDFKAVQYPREKHEDCLKDVMALANADVEGDRFLVLGVKLRPDGTRHFCGVPRDEFRDGAEFQQLITQNIEPELTVDYVPLELKGVLVGALRIHGCFDPPYLMRKQYGSLQPGEGWVRKGSHQARLTRKDYERLAAFRLRGQDLGSKIRVSFSSDELIAEKSVASYGKLTLPSAEAADKIKRILAERRRLPASGGPFGWRVTQNLGASLLGGPTPYEQRDTETLKANLESVEETYAKHDLHHVFELSTHHLQLYVYNDGGAYAEDASIHLRLPLMTGLEVTSEVHREPPPPRGPLEPYVPDLDFDVGPHYPIVQKTQDALEVSSHIGDIRHGLWTPAFDRKLRILLTPKLEGSSIPIVYRIFAKNLPRPAEGKLILHVTAAEQALPPPG